MPKRKTFDGKAVDVSLTLLNRARELLQLMGRDTFESQIILAKQVLANYQDEHNVSLHDACMVLIGEIYDPIPINLLILASFPDIDWLDISKGSCNAEA